MFSYDQMPPMESLPCSIVVVEQHMINGEASADSFYDSILPFLFVKDTYVPRS